MSRYNEAMAKNSPKADFRSVRRMLPPEAFVINEEMNIPSTDLVTKQVWDGLMHLPDDVALRIPSHDGLRLERA